MDKIKLSDNKMRKIDKNVKVLRNPHTGRMVKSTSKLGKQILLEQSKFNQVVVHILKKMILQN